MLCLVEFSFSYQNTSTFDKKLLSGLELPLARHGFSTSLSNTKDRTLSTTARDTERTRGDRQRVRKELGLATRKGTLPTKSSLNVSTSKFERLFCVTLSDSRKIHFSNNLIDGKGVVIGKKGHSKPKVCIYRSKNTSR